MSPLHSREFLFAHPHSKRLEYTRNAHGPGETLEGIFSVVISGGETDRHVIKGLTLMNGLVKPEEVGQVT